MPKRYSSRQVVTVLQSEGFSFVSQRGSHVKYRRSGHGARTVIVPAGRKELPAGTFRSILRQAGLDAAVFEEYLS